MKKEKRAKFAQGTVPEDGFISYENFLSPSYDQTSYEKLDKRFNLRAEGRKMMIGNRR